MPVPITSKPNDTENIGRIGYVIGMSRSILGFLPIGCHSNIFKSWFCYVSFKVISGIPVGHLMATWVSVVSSPAADVAQDVPYM